MVIVKVAGHACIRVHKMAIPLADRGHEVHIISKKTPGPIQYYKTFVSCFGINQYVAAIKLYSTIADIFHCHNEPSWFVQAIKEQCDVPVVLDVHDSFLARIKVDDEILEKNEEACRVYTEERTNFQLADALIFPGEAFADLVCNEYKLTQPRLILPSYLPQMFYQYSGMGWRGGLIYEGRVDLPEEHNGYAHGFHYDDYLELAKKCKELEMDFHIYPCRQDEKFVNTYKDYAFIHKPKLFDEMVMSIQKHDWGLVGNLHKSPEWEIAFPNKMFEYIAANIPVVAINAPACGKFLKEEGLGIEVESIEELGERWKEHTEIRKNLIKNRNKFIMENHIWKLEELYAKLLGWGVEKKNSGK